MKPPFVIPALVLLLCGCAMQSTIAPEEVLQRSTIANQAITSARFTFDADIDRGMQTITVESEGIIQNGGEQFQFTFDANGSDTESEWSAVGDVVVAGQNEIYTKLDSIEIEPPHPIFSSPSFEALIGQWWLMPSGSGATTDPSITPDPRFLRMQTDVIEVVKDRGIITMDGTKVHHYNAVVDKEKLAAFMNEITLQGGNQTISETLPTIDMTGELWIDAQTYVIRKAEWSVRSSDANNPLEAAIELNVTDHNAGATVTPPAQAMPVPAGFLNPSVSLPGVTPLE